MSDIIRVALSSLVVEKVDHRLLVTRTKDLWENVIFINRDEAQHLANILKRFAETGRVDDDAERAEVPC